MIKEIGHIIVPTCDALKFYNMVRENIDTMQRHGLRVEIQYQQSDHGCSALIIGRETLSTTLCEHKGEGKTTAGTVLTVRRAGPSGE